MKEEIWGRNFEDSGARIQTNRSLGNEMRNCMENVSEIRWKCGRDNQERGFGKVD